LTVTLMVHVWGDPDTFVGAVHVGVAVAPFVNVPLPLSAGTQSALHEYPNVWLRLSLAATLKLAVPPDPTLLGVPLGCWVIVNECAAEFTVWM
jgi:hypothetical protein